MSISYSTPIRAIYSIESLFYLIYNVNDVLNPYIIL